ncbi:MAG: hypothetical protein WC730_03730 [Patescibacteria group bacterium]
MSVYTAYSYVMTICILGDIAMNPWLIKDVETWPWYGYLLSVHTYTAIYINYGLLVLVPIFLVAFVWSIIIYFRLGDEMGITPTLGDTWKQLTAEDSTESRV